jgi:hypothetical protein
MSFLEAVSSCEKVAELKQQQVPHRHQREVQATLERGLLRILYDNESQETAGIAEGGGCLTQKRGAGKGSHRSDRGDIA